MKALDTKSDAGRHVESFSLNCEPFADNIDNRFFYGGTTLMQRLDLLSHLTQFGDSVVLVSGPSGSGKTTLLSRFASQANSQWHMCLMNADEFDRFSERLADTLKSETAASEQELFSQWAARTDNSQLLVIVIDNSEQLGDDALERLCAFLQQTTVHRVRLILFGEPAAQQHHKQAFERKQLECSTQLLEMPRMSEEETASYLMYRLAVAGYSGENPFTATEIRAICKASDGRPADINRLARQALLEHQARAKSKRVSVRKVRRKVGSLTWGLATAGILALTIWLGWQKLYPPPPDGAPIARAPMEERPLAIPKPAPLTVPTVTSPPAKEMTVTPEPQATEAPPKEPRLEGEPDPVTTVETRLDASRKEPATPESAIETPPMAGVTDEKPLPPVTEQATTAAVRAAPEPPATTLDKEPVQRSDTQSPAATPTLEAAAEPAAESEQLPHRENWLLAQPGTSFSLQLLGSRNAESIARYIQQHQLDIRQSAIYKGMYKGAEWHVLLYGIYPSRQAATEARSTLPAAVRSDKPWPRTLKTVHSAIREVQ